jgi:Methyltransferase domain
MLCKICSTSSSPLSKARILGKYTIQYYRCVTCGFVQTEDPFWLSEAYADVINVNDIGLLSRNIRTAIITRLLLKAFYNTRAAYLDYGGGFGIFTRLMRDYGFNYFHHDKLCQNIFAKGYEVEQLDDIQYEMITAIEVAEHMKDPVEEIGNLVSYSDNVLLTTNLIPNCIQYPEDNWYYSLDNGQHISLYTKESLSRVAAMFSMNIYTNGVDLHLLTRNKIPKLIYRISCCYRLAKILSIVDNSTKSLEKEYKQTISGKYING